MPEEHVFELEDEKIFECPQDLVDLEAMEAVEMWAWMKRGFLPQAGGIDDQYERDLEKMLVVEEEAAKKAGE